MKLILRDEQVDIDPLVNIHVTMENHHFLYVNQRTQWPFSMSQTVNVFFEMPRSSAKDWRIHWEALGLGQGLGLVHGDLAGSPDGHHRWSLGQWRDSDGTVMGQWCAQVAFLYFFDGVICLGGTVLANGHCAQAANFLEVHSSGVLLENGGTFARMRNKVTSDIARSNEISLQSVGTLHFLFLTNVRVTFFTVPDLQVMCLSSSRPSSRPSW